MSSARAKKLEGLPLPRCFVRPTEPPCLAGYEGKFVHTHYWRNAWRGGGIGVAFYHSDTAGEAQDAVDRCNAQRDADDARQKGRVPQ